MAKEPQTAQGYSGRVGGQEGGGRVPGWNNGESEGVEKSVSRG